jgi:hypothetical protein
MEGQFGYQTVGTRKRLNFGGGGLTTGCRVETVEAAFNKVTFSLRVVLSQKPSRGSQLMSCRARHCERSQFVSENCQLFNFQHPCPNAFFQWVSFFNKLGTKVSPSILASRLRCEALEAAGGRVECGYRMALFNRLPLRRTPGKIQVPRHNQQKETIDLGVVSHREVWIVIRYLDPELDRRECDTAAAIACLAVVCIVCIVWVLLRVRGL